MDRTSNSRDVCNVVAPARTTPDDLIVSEAASALCLIVDDDRGVRTMIARLLGEQMVRTEECGDARSALEALKRQTPELIFLDVSLARLVEAAVCRNW